MTKPLENSAGPTNSTPTALAKIPPVEIELPQEAIPTDAEAEQALRELGMVNMPASAIAQFRKLGVHFKGQGVIKTVRGESFLARHVALNAMMSASKYFDGVENSKGKLKPMKPKDAVDVTKAIATTLSKLTEAHKCVISMEQKEKPDGMPVDDEPTGKSFPPGTYVAVAPGAEAHFHNGEKPAKPESSIPIIEVPPAQKDIANPPPAA